MFTTARVVVACALLQLLPLAALAHGPRHHPRERAHPPAPRLGYHAAVRIGEFEPDGDSDLWAENVRLYGLTPEGLDGTNIGLEFGMLMGNHLEAVFALDYSGADNSSYRSVDTTGVPIVLSHDLDIMPVTAGIRFLPLGRYGGNGGFHRLVPYIGGGVGLYFWDYEEWGDFIEPGSGFITTGRSYADGTALGTYVSVGLEVAFSPFWSLSLEGRRSFVDDDLGSLFAGFEDLDLSGDTLSVGASFRF